MKLTIFFIISTLVCVGLCVKQYTTPVIFMHGLTGDQTAGQLLGDILAREHPGQPFVSLPVDNGDLSYKSLYEQTKDIQDVIQTLIDSYPEAFVNGFHLVGHSQGGLLTRAVVEESDNFNIRNYISLAGVQGGEFGHCDAFGNPDCEALTKYLYDPQMSNSTSVAQFWRHPDPDVYMAGNVFLPVINNEVNPDPRRKNNMLRLKHMYLFASDADEAIAPWQSSLLGFWDTDGQNVVPMEKQNYYVQDTFGLRTLKETNRLTLTSVSGRSHNSWLEEEDLIMQYIIPALED